MTITTEPDTILWPRNKVQNRLWVCVLGNCSYNFVQSTKLTSNLFMQTLMCLKYDFSSYLIGFH